MTDQLKRMTLRMTKELSNSLQESAKNNGNGSVTAEILDRLNKSFEVDPVDKDQIFPEIIKLANGISDIATQLDEATKDITYNGRKYFNLFKDLSDKDQQNIIILMQSMSLEKDQE